MRIIDFDKCYIQSGDGWKESNLERPKRSFEKELIKRKINWTLNEWPRVMKSYGIHYERLDH